MMFQFLFFCKASIKVHNTWMTGPRITSSRGTSNRSVPAFRGVFAGTGSRDTSCMRNFSGKIPDNFFGNSRRNQVSDTSFRVNGCFKFCFIFYHSDNLLLTPASHASMRSIMSSVKSAENGQPFGVPRQVPFPVTDSGLAGPIAEPADNAAREMVRDLFRMDGIELSATEVTELTILLEFLSRHVRSVSDCDVQCMLLWNEWVRGYRRRVNRFPDLIREKEFKTIITGMFGTGIADDGWRGPVYPGVRFMP